MSAYDHLLSYNSKSHFKEFRHVLVTNRGTLANGNLSEGLLIQYDKNKTQTEQEQLFDEPGGQIVNKPRKIYQRVGSAQQPGIVFDKNGAEAVITSVVTGGHFRINDQLMHDFKFLQDADKENWRETTSQNRRYCVAKNLLDMVKKTDINYRTNGDRMHYLVNGLVTIETSQGKSGKYPLFLFNCTMLDRNNFKADIEQTGFLNFWLDNNLLDGNINKLNGNSIEIALDEKFNSRSNEIISKLNRMHFPEITEIKIDPSYLALSIVTGFEAEYIDPAWQKILQGDEQ